MTINCLYARDGWRISVSFDAKFRQDSQMQQDSLSLSLLTAKVMTEFNYPLDHPRSFLERYLDHYPTCLHSRARALENEV